MIDLSVLVCSTHTRYNTFGLRIQEELYRQREALPPELAVATEIIVLTDTKTMMLGHKRNVMVDMAQGHYVVFVDDDDRLEPDYLKSLMSAIATGDDADVITFLVSVTLNGGKPKLCRYSRDFKSDRNPPGRYERMPNHICAVKREKALQVSFPNVAYGEDAGYSKLLQPLLESEHHIPRVLYHYDYNIETTEAQEHRRAALRRRDVKPIADVVIISDARTVALHQMTQETIDTCIAGANSLPVNVTVIEQNPGVHYCHSSTVHPLPPFNYNAYANRGAKKGSAPWIVVANNDLIFHDGWLHKLLAANHGVVSPKCPHDSRQKHHTLNYRGDKVGADFSGWCFMLSRSLWEAIGGLDEDFPFWCADDATVRQVIEAGVMPEIVPDAVVEHLRSVTLQQTPEATDLCWAGIDKFIEKYGPHKLANHHGYRKWKAQQKVTR